MGFFSGFIIDLEIFIVSAENKDILEIKYLIEFYNQFFVVDFLERL